MQQRQGLAGQETVVDEEGLFDRQARVAALQLAGAIVLNALRQDQILGASGRAHRVGLDEAQARNGPRQAGGLEKAARDRVAAKLPESGGFERAHEFRPRYTRGRLYGRELQYCPEAAQATMPWRSREHSATAALQPHRSSRRNKRSNVSSTPFRRANSRNAK